MKLSPRNRRLLVEKVLFEEDQEKKVEGFVTGIPNETRQKLHNLVFRVVEVSPKVELDVNVGDLILIEKGMADSDMVNGVEHITVLENYVKGVLVDD